MRRDDAFTITVPFDTGASSQTITTNVGALDLSRRQAIRGVLSCTKADTDAADTFDARLQILEQDAITWTTIMRWDALTGDMSPSTTAPEVRVLIVQNEIPLSTPEMDYETDGSAGASATGLIVAGSVRNGPFPGKVRTAAGLQNNLRMQFVVVDADADGDFEGTVYLTVY